MLVDGYDEVLVGLVSGARPLAVYFCSELVRETERLSLVDQLLGQGIEVLRVSEPVFRKIAYRQAPDGWLAVFPTVASDLARLELSSDALVLVCESVEKPGNLGAILRTADAAGLSAVISSGGATDWGNPNIVRASKGAIFSVPVAEANAAELVSWLRTNGLAIVAATPDAEAAYTSADLRGGVAIVVGAESRGLTPEWLLAADATVRIPMSGRLNSLNVATTAALLIYEALRQRGRLP
jgi:TrmH family RNA methyltransferase